MVAASVLPGGNFNILSALASILLNRKEAGRDRYIAILDDHFSREHNPNIWKALLYRLAIRRRLDAAGSVDFRPQVV